MMLQTLILVMWFQFTPSAQTIYNYCIDNIVAVRHQWTEAEITYIYNRLLKNNKVPHLPLKFSSNPNINAYNDGESITVLAGIMDGRNRMGWQNADEVAVTLGHELGHSAKDVIAEPLLGVELGADRKGFEYADNAGYDYCVGAKFLLRTGNGGWDHGKFKGQWFWNYHPSGKARYYQVQDDCE